MDHFLHPRNMGELPDADGIGTVGNPICGDVMKMYLRVGKREVGSVSGSEGEKWEEYVEDVKFQTLGCAAAIATSSMATEMIKGKPVEDALKLTKKTIVEALEGLPKTKIHCSVLAAEAVKKAINDYRSKNSNNQIPNSKQI